MNTCRKCGKGLSDPKSIRLGIGPVCLLKERGKVNEQKARMIPPKFHGFIMMEELKGINEIKTYLGQRLPMKDVKVEMIDEEVPLRYTTKELRHIPYHSPDGFEWGYGGSGPADLARSILYDFAGARVADTFYQEFKFDFIATLDKDEFIIKGRDILYWLRKKIKEKEDTK